MIPGRFFKLDDRFPDFSVYQYTAIVNQNADAGRKYPIYFKLSSSYIGFYIHTTSQPPANHELLILSIFDDNKYGGTVKILSEIFFEPIEGQEGMYQIEKNEENDFFGYVDAYGDLFPEGLYKQRIKIFLDFLFDFKHSQVFENWLHYEDLRSFIENDFFVSSILAKNDFYFTRKEYFAFRPKDRKQKRFFSRRFQEAEDKWLEKLFQEESRRFSFVTGWFDDVESELDRVLFGAQPQPNISRKEITYYHFFEFDKSKKNGNLLEKQNGEILNFYLKTYNYSKAYKFIVANDSTWRRRVARWGGYWLTRIRVWFLLLLTGFALIYLDALSPCCFIIILGGLGLMVPLLVPALQLLINIIKSLRGHLISVNRDQTLSPPPVYNVSASTPKMSISILTAWLALFPFSEELWELNKMLSDDNKLFLSLFGLIFLLIVFTINNEIKMISPSRNNIRESDAIISRPGMKRFFYRPFWNQLFEKIHQSKIWKTTLVLILGFSFSIAIGIPALHFSSRYTFDDPDLLPVSILTRIDDERLSLIAEEQNKAVAQADSVNALSFIDFYTLEKKRQGTVVPLNYHLDEQDSLYVVKQKEEQLALLNRKYIDLESQRKKALKNAMEKLAKRCEGRHPILPIMTHSSLLNIFVFPRLLFLNALIAFVIGFFIQYITENRSNKEPI